jgi:hypothetical protein
MFAYIKNTISYIVKCILQYSSNKPNRKNKLDKVKYKNIIHLLENKPKIQTINNTDICYSFVTLSKNMKLLCQIDNKQVFIEYCLSRRTMYKKWFRVYPINQFKKNYLYLMTLHSKWMPNHSKWAL